MGAEGPGGLEGLAEMDGSVVAVAVATLAAATAVVVAVVVAAAAREGPCRMAGGAGLVVGSAAGM